MTGKVRLVHNVQEILSTASRIYRSVFGIRNSKLPIIMVHVAESELDDAVPDVNIVRLPTPTLYLEFYTVHGSARLFLEYLYALSKAVKMRVVAIVRADKVPWTKQECERLSNYYGFRYRKDGDAHIFELA